MTKTLRAQAIAALQDLLALHGALCEAVSLLSRGISETDGDLSTTERQYQAIILLRERTMPLEEVVHLIGSDQNVKRVRENKSVPVQLTVQQRYPGISQTERMHLLGSAATAVAAVLKDTTPTSDQVNCDYAIEVIITILACGLAQLKHVPRQPAAALLALHRELQRFMLWPQPEVSQNPPPLVQLQSIVGYYAPGLRLLWPSL